VDSSRVNSSSSTDTKTSYVGFLRKNALRCADLLMLIRASIVVLTNAIREKYLSAKRATPRVRRQPRMIRSGRMALTDIRARNLPVTQIPIARCASPSAETLPYIFSF
jgi:hypothetical protein